ncbi:hypothetical protein [Nesterenkonia sp. HG001]|uniref:hypothetical protein n=1 Tax=Nesterenkonia sp. HG001 TaxID=2983207 RepID=UPI002AC7B4FE|nr:hypothetical protein [Nesterenkonia sp. HG001]MDZ5077881.1 hypothetical protein [Nesterenkonia sp. HG001]
MNSPRFAAAIFLLAAASLTACAGDESEDAGPSAECLDAMSAAADEPDPDAADPLIKDTAYACDSPEEWEAALAEYPGAMGLTERADVSGSINTVCYSVPDAPACEGVE